MFLAISFCFLPTTFRPLFSNGVVEFLLAQKSPCYAGLEAHPAPVRV
jgi:hypothetical protein